MEAVHVVVVEGFDQNHHPPPLLPVILVTSGRLGSINHTLLSIEALVNRNIPLYGIVYNTFPKTDERIDKDTEEYLKTYLNEHFPQAHFWTLPEIALPR